MPTTQPPPAVSADAVVSVTPALALPTSNGFADSTEPATNGQLTSAPTPARTKTGAGVCGVGNGGSGLVGFLVSGGGWGRGL
ncbi:hypothetical protein AB0P21_22895 [Kribbella sp. NPDC056861]|uniref:hypothetical protein n=1 Tax=Kribbella sp. NPDC056861 TaxID=3154857 RepID=UPI00344710A6